MAAGATYTPIATQTLGSATATVTATATAIATSTETNQHATQHERAMANSKH